MGCMFYYIPHKSGSYMLPIGLIGKGGLKLNPYYVFMKAGIKNIDPTTDFLVRQFERVQYMYIYIYMFIYIWTPIVRQLSLSYEDHFNTPRPEKLQSWGKYICVYIYILTEKTTFPFPIKLNGI